MAVGRCALLDKKRDQFRNRCWAGNNVSASEEQGSDEMDLSLHLHKNVSDIYSFKIPALFYHRCDAQA